MISNNSDRDYIARHRKIRDKVIELSKTSEHACFDVAQLASELKMDIRTVRAHLKIMEIDAIGTFLDDKRKQFCTKEGIVFLANTFKVP
jgi:DNA-binding transcriptional ArsR family regulator